MTTLHRKKNLDNNLKNKNVYGNIDRTDNINIDDDDSRITNTNDIKNINRNYNRNIATNNNRNIDITYNRNIGKILYHNHNSNGRYLY
jgi:hypothetical protein